MLAQNFKTAAELRINEREHAALITVLGMLERGELKHQRLDGRALTPNPGPNFNMAFLMIRDPVRNCGTVGCICGWARAITGDADLFAVRMLLNDPLLETFMIMMMKIAYRQDWDRDKVTTDQAAAGLRNFLTHGNPRWDEVGVPRL